MNLSKFARYGIIIFMGLIIPKKKSVVQEYDYGVCVWRVPTGGYIKDSDGNFLAAEGRLKDPIIEKKMYEAAKYWMGQDFGGQPEWLPGRRKVSDDEYDDQVARLEAGQIPDIVEEARQAERNK